MSILHIYNATVVLSDRVLKKHSLLCEDGRIRFVIPAETALSIQADEMVDAQECYIAPGFIDLHIHGTRNLLIDKGSIYLEDLCRILPQYGVTGFLPTVCPQKSCEEDLVLLQSLANIQSEGTSILGFLLEGHFLKLTGAIFNLPAGRTVERVNMLMEAARPYKVVFCISPEFEGITEFLPIMTQVNIPAFITHTAATVEQTKAAILKGAVHATHFFDVFPYPGEKDIGVRTCGAVEAILADPDVSIDFILDGEHVDPVAVQVALACKDPDKVCLITDANANAGMPPGRYESLGGYDIDVLYEGGPARCAETGPIPGALAGSGLTMDKAVRNAVKMLGIDVPQAIKMASANPAGVLGIAGNKGFIREGYDADLVMLDSELNVVKTWVKGRCCFSK